MLAFGWKWRPLQASVVLLILSLLPLDILVAILYAKAVAASWRTFDCPALDELFRSGTSLSQSPWERNHAVAHVPPEERGTPYVRPAFAERMQMLRPVILAAAARHNRPRFSGMSNEEFAEVIALVLYNEHVGWLEDALPWLRGITPIYQQMQIAANLSGRGANYTVWPSNLRPSVALEIIRQELPLADSAKPVTVPIRVKGSAIDPDQYRKQAELFAAITAEIIQDDLAVEYLAANLERGMYRAVAEGVAVNWQVLAAWHNQGIVHPDQIRGNRSAREYICRASAYLPIARQLISTGATKVQKL